jgi:hypothetical protein
MFPVRYGLDSYILFEEKQKIWLPRREQISWSWILRRLKPGMTVLAKTSSNLTDRPTKVWSWAPDAGSYQDRSTDRPNVILTLTLTLTV